MAGIGAMTEAEVLKRYAAIVQEVTRVVEALLAEGRPHAVGEAVRALLARRGLATSARRALTAFASNVQSDIEAQLQAQFVDGRTLSQQSAFARDVRAMLGVTLGGFARIDGRIEKAAVRAVERGIRTGARESEIARAVERATGNSAAYARTAARTGIAGFSRALTIQSAIAAGKNILWDGPTPERPLCVENTGKVFTYEQLAGMSNGHGLPVPYYLGGYGCVHRPVATDKPPTYA